MTGTEYESNEDENEVFLIDSNVLIYNYDSADQNRHKKAKLLIDKCWKREKKFAVSSQNLSEFFFVTTKKKLLAKKDARDIVSNIIDFSGWIKLNFNHKTVLKAAHLSEDYSISFWDALIAATMLKSSIFSIYTENEKDFAKIKGISVINPFK